MPDAVARAGGMEGYEQLCGVSGTVRTGGRSAHVRCLGQRGHAWGEPDWERIEIKGEPAKLDFIAYYIRGGKAVAACAIGHNPEMIRFVDTLATDGPPSAHALG